MTNKDADYRKYNDHTQNSSTYNKKDGTYIINKLKQEALKQIRQYFLNDTRNK